MSMRVMLTGAAASFVDKCSLDRLRLHCLMHSGDMMGRCRNRKISELPCRQSSQNATCLCPLQTIPSPPPLPFLQSASTLPSIFCHPPALTLNQLYLEAVDWVKAGEASLDQLLHSAVPDHLIGTQLHAREFASKESIGPAYHPNGHTNPSSR